MIYWIYCRDSVTIKEKIPFLTPKMGKKGRKPSDFGHSRLIRFFPYFS